MANLRDDTLGRILSTANVHAGQYVLVADDAVQGILTASCVKRMGGYGTVMGLYPGKFVPGYVDVTAGRMNYNLRERQMLRWISMGEVFGEINNNNNSSSSSRRRHREGSSNECTDSVAAAAAIVDIEKRDRERISWPAPLMPHTRQYITNELQTEQRINIFLEKRSARFTRKLTRYSALELRKLIGSFRNEKEVYSSIEQRHNTNGHGNDDDDGGGGGGRKERVRMEKVDEKDGDDDDDGTRTTNTSTMPSPPRQCDSLIIATKYDPTTTLFGLLPYLAPSCPFVVYSEFLEPLLRTFHALQNYFVPEYGGSKDVSGVKSSDKKNEEGDTDDNTPPEGSDRGTGAGAMKPPPMMQRRNIAINLRLTDSWFREYQVLEGRTHPNMSMSQNGGYVLAGTKLCPLTGTNELDDIVMKGIRAKLGGRRRQANTKRGGGLRAAKRKRVENGGGGGGGEEESERIAKK